MPRTARPVRGFTLIEMMVVLLIAGMMLSVAPVLLNSLPGERLRAAADDMVTTLRGLRSEAIGSGRGTALLLDPLSRSYDLLPDGGRRPLPDAVSAVSATTAAPLQSGGAALFRFFPDGTASGGTIALHGGDSVISIAVDWLTGRVRRMD